MALSFAAVGAKITAAFVNAIISRVNRMGSTAIIPTNVTGAGAGTPVVVGADGTITCIAATRIDFTAFSSEFTSYTIEMVGEAPTTDMGVSFQVRSGTGAAIATGYDYKAIWDTAAAHTVNADAVNQTVYLASVGNPATDTTTQIDVLRPFLAKRTIFRSRYQGVTGSTGANMLLGSSAGSQRNSTSYDGGVITPAAAWTGTITIKASW